MAVIKVTSELGNLGFDRRWRQWAKLIRDAGDFNPDAEGALAITGPWAKWGETVAVEPPAFLVLASETGSTKHRAYDYALVCINPDGSTTLIPRQQAMAQIRESYFHDNIKAKVENSEAYSYGAYACLVFAGWEAQKQRMEEVGKWCPICHERIRLIETLCRTCLDRAIRQLDSLETARMAWQAAEYAIHRIQS